MIITLKLLDSTLNLNLRESVHTSHSWVPPFPSGGLFLSLHFHGHTLPVSITYH